MNKLGRKKAMLYGLLLLGAIVGLLMDRLRAVDGSIAPASGTAHRPTGPGAALRPVADEVHGPALARVFELTTGRDPESRPATADPVRDAFVMTPRMQAVYEVVSPAKKAEQEKQVENEDELRRKELEQFRSTHKLKGTSLREGDAWALIDERFVRVGERIDGFELKRVERYRVELTKGSLTATLTLPLP